MRRRNLTPGTNATSVQVMGTRKFRKAFLGSLSRNIKSLLIVSPFVTAIPGFDSPSGFFQRLIARLPDVAVRLITRPPRNNQQGILTWPEAERIHTLGVELFVRSSPPLHSKLYYITYEQGDSTSFVGSANFTLGGLEKNDETMALWRVGSSNREIERELARLVGPGTFTFLQWKSRTRHSSTDL